MDEQVACVDVVRLDPGAEGAGDGDEQGWTGLLRHSELILNLNEDKGGSRVCPLSGMQSAIDPSPVFLFHHWDFLC